MAHFNRRVTRAALGALLALAMTSGALAADAKAGGIAVEHPWTRATLPNAPVAGGYMTLTNTGKDADRLVGGSTPIAGKVEVHQMSMQDGVMKMRSLPDGLEIPAGQSVTLKPGGYHLMLLDPKRRLKEGEHVPLTLRFRKAGAVTVELAVESVGAIGPAGAAGGNAMPGKSSGPSGPKTK
ncbi:copper chaperone PCu(A)C [Jiella sp. M17.18]|uniref:copper chaperone PCu(A)C n=1 Tax=Jiella sp. M17.18 TaxID=3234247 RepID=UPI0034DF5F9F